MDKWMIGYIWFLSLMGAVFYGHEIGMMKGEHQAESELRVEVNNCEPSFSGITE